MTENNVNFFFGSSVLSQFYLFRILIRFRIFSCSYVYPFITTLFMANVACFTCLVSARFSKNMHNITLYSQRRRNLETESLLLALIGHKLISFENFFLKQQLFTWNNTILNASSSMPRPQLLENQEVICRLKKQQKT